MTCIIGLVRDGKVYIGADSASVGGYEVRATKLPKVFRRDGFLIGYTTSFRMGQLLQHSLEARIQTEDEDDIQYMVCGFVEAVRKLFKENGFAEIEKNQERGGQFLVGYRGHLYAIDSDYQVNEFIDCVEAIGCGREYALGAMRAFQGSPEVRIRKALEISAFYSRAVCGPFTVMSI